MSLVIIRHLPRASVRLLTGATALLSLTACAYMPSAPSLPGDFDLRGFGSAFSTSEAASTIGTRPQPDARGIISYPSYQVVVARQGDTVASVAQRIGLEATALARHNGLEPSTQMRANEVLSLPSRVSEPAASSAAQSATEATGALTTNAAAVNAAGSVTTSSLAPLAASNTTPTAAAAPTPAASASPSVEPTRHHVVRGETAYTIARRYNVPVRSLAEWNGLDSNMSIREGQYLLIPTAGATPPAAVSRPGEGSPTPVPPSAGQPLPTGAAATTSATAAAAAAAPAQPTPNLGAQQSTTSSALRRPVAGNIIRAYSKGRNDGIDIGAPAGTEVKAAAAGTVAALTTNTDGVNIMVLRHDDNLMTVYTHIDQLAVQKDARVSAGQTLGKVRAGSPSFLHFEVRRGLDSIDPTIMLP